MNKTLLVSFLYLLVFCSANAQYTLVPTKPITPGVAFTGDWVTVFERPNYQGQKKTFTETSNNLDLPFTSGRISIKVKPGAKVFFKSGCAEFPSEFGVVGDQPDFPMATNSLCAVRLAKAARVSINYRGILQAIHNNDCRYVYGKVAYTVYEINEQGERINCKAGTTFSSPFTNIVFEQIKGKKSFPPAIFNSSDFYVADRDYVNGMNWDDRRIKPSITTRPESVNRPLEFWVDEAAYARNKVFLEVKIKLGSAHKSGDLSTDFTWDAEMTTEEIRTIELNRLPGAARFRDLSTLQIGAFRQVATGPVTFTGGGGVFDGPTQNGGVGFTGPPHNTYVQFSITR